VTVIVNIIDQKAGEDHGDDDEHRAAIPEKTKSDTGIMDEGKAQDVRDDSDRFVQVQKAGKEILGQTVKKDNCHDTRKKNNNIPLGTTGILHGR
jgi:hypothetical protein